MSDCKLKVAELKKQRIGLQKEVIPRKEWLGVQLDKIDPGL